MCTQSGENMKKRITHLDDAIIDAAEQLADQDIASLGRERGIDDWYWAGVNQWEELPLARLIDKAGVEKLSGEQIKLAKSAYVTKFKRYGRWELN